VEVITAPDDGQITNAVWEEKQKSRRGAAAFLYFLMNGAQERTRTFTPRGAAT
jgi:hypothetical protein